MNREEAADPPLDVRAAATRGLGWTVLKSVSSRFIGSAAFILLARLLDPADFGIVALATVFVVLITVLVESGFGEAIIARKVVTPTDLNSAFWANTLVGVVLALILVVSAGPLSSAIGQPDLPPVLRALSLVFVFAALASVPQAILRRELAFKAIALRSLAGTLTGAVVGVAMAVAGAGIWSLVGQLVTTAAVGTATLWVLSSWRPTGFGSLASIKGLARFSGNILGERLALFASRRSDDFLIGLVLGAVALGLYSVAYRIILILTETIIWTLEGVAFPLLSRLREDPERRREVFYSLTAVCALAAVPTFAALAILASEFTRVAFGERWVDAIPVMQTLALVGLPHAAVYCNKAALNAAGRADLSLRIAVLTAVVNVIAFAVVVRWGILAVAASYVVCSYLLVPVSVWSVTRVLELDVTTYLRLFAAPLISALGMVVCVVGVKAVLGDANDGVRLALSLGVAVTTYLGMLFLVARQQVRGLLSQVRAPAAGT